jgi:hypothetical protein
MYSKMLQEHVCEVTFTKKNGDERIMICTLMPEFLPVHETNTDNPIDFPKYNEPLVNGIYTVWDLEADAWRSFRADSVISFDHDDE